MKHETRNARHEARILVMAMMAVCSAVALAMPTQQQLKKAQPLVAELMTPIMDDFKAKKKTAAEVADAAVKYAAEAETEAAKFMLYRSSIPYFVRGEAYDKAADAVELMKANVKDVPASVIEEIISKATVRANKEKAPRLFELYQQAKTQASAEQDVKELRKKPASTANKRKLAEALATAGDWQEALKVFASLTDQAAKMAKGEQDGSAKSAELGEFWWAYKPTYEDAEDTFKIHAAFHYRKALAAGEITGLKKNIVEQRIKEFGDAAETVNGEVKTVSGKQMATRKLTYEGFLTRVNTLLWNGVSVNDIQSFTSTMAGSYIGKPGEAVGFVVDSGDGWKAVQFQHVDGEHLKCVCARFEQRGSEVRGFVECCYYASASVAMGTDFRTVTSARKHSYGIKDLVVTVGGKGAVMPASAATTPSAAKSVADEKDSDAYYPREDFGGELLSSKYEIVEATGGMCFVHYSDGLFNCQKTDKRNCHDFAFQVGSKDKEAGFVLKLSESISLAGLLIVNRTAVCLERQVPLCVWASEDRVKWERIFLDESVKAEYRMDLSDKNITCKYLRFGRLPGVSDEPFHLARTLIYVKKTPATKQAKNGKK